MGAFVSAIILAGGESKRMGKPKQLMPLGKVTILEQAVDNLLHSAVDEVIVVVGYRAEEVMKTIAGRPVKTVLNPAYLQGMSSSIVAGLGRIDDRAQAFMLALADQPFVDSQTINRLLEVFLAQNKGIALPVYHGRRGHPVIFALRYKDQFLKQKGDIGGREIVNGCPDDVLEVAVDCEGVCLDIDTAESYNTARRKI